MDDRANPSEAIFNHRPSILDLLFSILFRVFRVLCCRPKEMKRLCD
jgi:hypothetical protein